jgi:hypothetical protein
MNQRQKFAAEFKCEAAHLLLLTSGKLTIKGD